ncbi:MAG TPA: hypothetical protein VK400_12665 [Pyrinomonadaceae bacterium]|nr:hypothetical protein [Pyrinomonadaceae bacterium]
MFKKIVKSKKQRVKTVKVTTRLAEHICTPDCFHKRPASKSRNLKKVSLGEVYQDNEGRFYTAWGEDDFLEVTGADFLTNSSGRLCLMFHPKEQLHIHSPGGRTIAESITEREFRPSPDFHAIEAAKKLKRKKKNLREAQTYLASKAAEVIPHSPKRKKPLKGTGRGAPGAPRSELGCEIVRLLKTGISKSNVLKKSVEFARSKQIPIAGSHLKKIKKQVNFWRKKLAP